MNGLKGSFRVAYIGLGANIGDKAKNFQKVLALLAAQPQVVLGKVSSFWETKPVGMDSSYLFLNGVCEIKTTLSPQGLLALLLQLEKQLGRDRSKGKDRIIDLDLLYYDNLEVRDKGLEVPHPRLKDREFVLGPWAEIAPALVLRPWRKSVAQLLEKVREKEQGKRT